MHVAALAEDAARDAAFADLPADDHAHVARFRFARDRAIALASRTLQRRALSACALDVAPDAWRFAAGPLGKPVIAAPTDGATLAFNVSNTHGLVGCAVTAGREVGLDLEPWRADAPPELVERCFAPVERAALAALPAAAQPRRFVELWTLKEAYIKARGLGLELPLEQIAFHFDDAAGPRLTLAPALGDDATAWQLALWTPTADHAAALCVRRDGGPPLALDHRWMLAGPTALSADRR